MKDLLLRQVKVTDPGGPHHGTVADVLIRGGRITDISERPKAATKRGRTAGTVREIALDGLHVSPGWVDLRAHFREPGEEWKEGIANGLNAAAAGGFTAVAVLPSTDPPIDGRAGVEHLLRRSAGHAVRLMPIGALTKGLKGRALAELHDLRQAGAVAFTDDRHAVRNTRLMLLALQYVNGLPDRGAPVMVFPNDPDLGAEGMMHEGSMSARLGMKGLPPMAETIQLARDLALLEYAGGHLHAATISTAGSVELVRQAKARGLNVTASVAAHNLLLGDGLLDGFDTRYKVLPPLRDAEHIAALREGVKDGTIDAIVSDHRPEDPEGKVVEYNRAAFGAPGLETCFAAANTALKGVTRRAADRVVERLTHGPRAVLGLPAVHLEEGAEEITLFHPGLEWTCTEDGLVSKSRYTPLAGRKLTGRPLGIVANGQAVIARELR